MKRRRGVGEFFLLVLGVFLALSAEGLLQDRADARLAQSYVVDLEQDLVRDSAIHAVWQHLSDLKMQALQALMDERSRDLHPTALAAHLYAAGIPTAVNLGTPTYVDLTGSGNLRLLPEDLRRALVRYEIEAANLERIVTEQSAPLRGRGFIPGRVSEALRVCQRECGTEAFTAGLVELEAAAAEVLSNESPGARTAMTNWPSAPGVGEALNVEFAEAMRFRFRHEQLREYLGAALEAARQ